MNEQRPPIPVTILTGFLGAGKTTLLNRILHAEHGLRIAVLVNDFGAVNIDSQLVANVEGETISMANGCICCTIRDDLFNAAKALVYQPNPPEYIVIEPSGVSDPSTVARTFFVLRPSVRVDGIIAVVDAEQIDRLTGQYQFLAINQIGAADMILLNKCDLVTPAQLAETKKWIRRMVPRARILESVQGNVPLELLLGVGNFSPEQLAAKGELDIHVHPEAPVDQEDQESDEHNHAHGHSHEHEHEHHDHSLLFSTWFYHSDTPLSIHALRRLMEKLPTGIFRAKGFVRLHESPDLRGVLQMVGSRGTLTLGLPWGDESPRTELVFIGEPGSIDPVELNKQIGQCQPGEVNAVRNLWEDVVEWVRTI